MKAETHTFSCLALEGTVPKFFYFKMKIVNIYLKRKPLKLGHINLNDQGK